MFENYTIKDIWVLQRNDIKDANCKSKTSDQFGYLCSNGDKYIWNYAEKGWFLPSNPKIFTNVEYFKEEDLKMNTHIEYIHGETVDGKTAFNAWYDGETVLVKYYMNDWKEFDPQDGYSIEVFKSKNHQFMIKPKTIMIGDVEVPAPFQPKDGEKYWHITTDEAKGYWWNNELDQYAQFGAWRTEEEIKQVVEALRKYLTVK